MSNGNIITVHTGLTAEEKAQKWLVESRDAIEEYEQFIQNHGCFGDTLRCF